MLNNTIAVQPKLQVLSTADCKQELVNNHHDPYDPFKNTIDFLREVEREAYEKRRKRIEAQEAAEKEELKKKYREYFEGKAKEEFNLYIAYMFLADRESEVELIPKFNKQEFIEVVSRILIPENLELLADKIYKLSESLNDKLIKIERFEDPDLSSRYYTQIDGSYSFNEYGSYDIIYPRDVPTQELLIMESENQLLSDLAGELNAIVEEQQAETIKQTLEA
jgi:hypothetical protein